MAIRVIVHIVDEEPFMADVEEMPTPSSTCIFFKKVCKAGKFKTVVSVPSPLFAIAKQDN